MRFSSRGIVSIAAAVAFCSSATQVPAATVYSSSAFVRPLTVAGSNGQNARIPTGQYITPMAAPGSAYQRLATGLRPDGNADADSAMTSALSPDGKTLLVLTSGFNYDTNKQVSQTAYNPVPLLFPALNPTTGTDTPFSAPTGVGPVGQSYLAYQIYNASGSPATVGTQVWQAEFVFVYNVAGKQPVKMQQIPIPDTFDGLAWSPDGSRFYVSGGVDDRVLIFKAQPASASAAAERVHTVTTSSAGRRPLVFRAGTPGPSAAATYVPDAPFVILNHNQMDSLTFPLDDGGALASTPLGQAALNPSAPPEVQEFALLLTGGIAAGVSVSHDGNTMLVANFENESASIVDLNPAHANYRKVTKEVTFTPGGTTSPSLAMGEFPFWTSVVSNYQTGEYVKGYVSSYRDDDVMVVQKNSTAAKEIKTCAGPNKMTLNGDGTTLYVACGNDDAIDVINTATDIVTRTISLARPGYRYKGSNPDSIAVSANGATLYVALGGENAVALVDVKSGRVLGRIPTGWLPTSVSVSADGSKLYVVNEKSNEGPDAGQQYYVPPGTPNVGSVVNPHNPTNANLYTWEGEKSGLLTIPLPDANELVYLSDIVDANNGFTTANASDPVMTALKTKIKHVIYIVNENRTFDQVLGDLSNGANGDPALTFFPQAITPNLHALSQDYVTFDNFYDSSETSGVGWNWAMQSHTDDFVEKTQPVQYGNSNSVPGMGLTYDWQGIVMNVNLGQPSICGPNPTIYNCRITTIARGGSTDSTILPGPKDPSASRGADDLNPSTLGGYIWESALRAGETYRNYGWQIDLSYYGTPFGPPEVPDPYEQHALQSSPSTPSIQPHTDEYYRAFDQSYPDIQRIDEWKREFRGFVQNGDMPNLMTMTIPHDHFGSYSAGDKYSGLGTPQLEMADHDYAIGQLVETVSHSPFWSSTAIVMIEDDPQNGQDHVEAHRSIAFIISPYTKSHYLDHTTYTTVNAVRTVEDLLGINHLSMYDENAVPMSTALTTSPDLQPYTPTIPGSLCQPPVHRNLVPACYSPQSTYRKTGAVPQLHPASWWEQHSRGMDFRGPDRVNARAFNQILEYGITGRGSLPTQAETARNSVGDTDD